MRYNLAPTQHAPVVRFDGREGFGPRALTTLRWGLVPSWAKDIKIGNSLINARAEGIEAKPSFRSAFKRRRCLMPVSGFYEWQKLADGKAKQPYYITSADEGPMAFAGLWEFWKPPEGEGEPVETYTIITTTPNEMMGAFHDRMPVILDQNDLQTMKLQDAQYTISFEVIATTCGAICKSAGMDCPGDGFCSDFVPENCRGGMGVD